MTWYQVQKVLAGVSVVLLLLGSVALIRGGLRPAVEFTGGTTLVVTASESAQLADVEQAVAEFAPDASVRRTGTAVALEMAPLTQAQKNDFVATLSARLQTPLREESFQTVGPSVGRDLIRKTLFAISLAIVLILAYLSRQFHNWRFGVAAILAMLHDLALVAGGYAWFGLVSTARLDILFVTAILTTLSFSVHDTIVMFDRLRELQRAQRGTPLVELARQAVVQTLSRSINNSLTIIFMLVTLILLGGESTRWFLVALLIGTVSGTYSSPFVAVPLYVWLEQRRRQR